MCILLLQSVFLHLVPSTDRQPRPLLQPKLHNPGTSSKAIPQTGHRCILFYCEKCFISTCWLWGFAEFSIPVIGTETRSSSHHLHMSHHWGMESTHILCCLRENTLCSKLHLVILACKTTGQYLKYTVSVCLAAKFFASFFALQQCHIINVIVQASYPIFFKVKLLLWHVWFGWVVYNTYQKLDGSHRWHQSSLTYTRELVPFVNTRTTMEAWRALTCTGVCRRRHYVACCDSWNWYDKPLARLAAWSRLEGIWF